MRVFWNKEFYEKYSSVFNIQVWAIKEIPDSNGYCYNYNYYSYDNTTTRSYIVLLDPSFGWSESRVLNDHRTEKTSTFLGRANGKYNTA